jgi:hypothetical protein
VKIIMSGPDCHTFGGSDRAFGFVFLFPTLFAITFLTAVLLQRYALERPASRLVGLTAIARALLVLFIATCAIILMEGPWTNTRDSLLFPDGRSCL